MDDARTNLFDLALLCTFLIGGDESLAEKAIQNLLERNGQTTALETTHHRIEVVIWTKDAPTD